MRKYETKLKNGNRLFVTVLVPGDWGNNKPMSYFSVTGEEYENGKLVHCGTLPEQILEVFPELHDAVRLHGSDELGVPMHAEENGWYWLAGALGGLDEKYHGGSSSGKYTRAKCRGFLRGHLRLSESEVSDMINTTHTIAKQESVEAAKDNFKLWIDDLRVRWSAEAEAAIKKYGDTE